MLSSFLLRLVPEALAERRIAGRVEAVESGEAASVRSADELIAFLVERGGRRDPGPRVPERTDPEETGP